MKIASDCVVSFHFTLKDESGKVLESSMGSEPLVYLHGAKNIVPGLEEALEGRVHGDKFEVTLPPEKAYGKRDEKLIQTIPLSQFPNPEVVKPGVQFQMSSPQGMMILTVKTVSDKEVTIDANPELAGQTLVFAIEVGEVRAASKEELQHGHVHGPGGHHHE